MRMAGRLVILPDKIAAREVADDPSILSLYLFQTNKMAALISIFTNKIKFNQHIGEQ